MKHTPNPEELSIEELRNEIIKLDHEIDDNLKDQYYNQHYFNQRMRSLGQKE